MSCGKRLAKRSILGTRVCAPMDGHYCSGIIKATKNSSIDTRDTVYSVLFDHSFGGRKVTLDFPAKQLIGPGFQSVMTTKLSKGQKIYLTYNGREVSGVVDTHDPSNGEVSLSIGGNAANNSNQNSLIISNNNNQTTIKVRRRLDEIRLLESRKSARLQEVDTDYSKLALDGSLSEQLRRRTGSVSSSVSNSSLSSHIDVPNIHNNRKRRPSSSSDDIMDDCMAAMVLMSLSCSPKSPRLPDGHLDEVRMLFQCTWPGCVQQYSTCNQIEQHVRTKHLGRSGETSDENDDREEEFYYKEIEMFGERCDSLGSSSMGSTTPSSGSPSSSSSPGPQSPTASIDGSCKGSDIQSPIPSPHLFFPSSSAPVWSHLEDHEYLKPLPQPPFFDARHTPAGAGIKIKFIDSNSFISNKNKDMKGATMLTAPINIPGLTNALNAHQYSKPMPISMSAPVSLQSPTSHHKYMRLNGVMKSSSGGAGTTLLHGGGTAGTGVAKSPTKRVRGESRKCRKVYGMDNRDSWCTQCKWKKACSRFIE